MANPFIRYGYIDLPYQTQIIDLRNNLEYLWDNIRKGHKSDIKKAANIIKVNIWNSENISVGKFRQYQALHQKDARRVTRSQKTFDLMYDWCRIGEAILVEAVFNNKSVGFALVIVYKEGAYYGSACKDPEHNKLPVSHLIQWEIIKYLKNCSISFYDIGIQDYSLQWFKPSSEKDVNISIFKRGFGGTTVPLITSEYYFSKELMRDRFIERMNKSYQLDYEK